MLIQISTCQTPDSVYLSGANLNEDETLTLNTDTANNEVDIYDISSHKGLKGELDTRLLTEDGRNQIAEDLLKTKMITDTIQQIATNETVGITDFFSNIKKENTTYDAIKEKIAQDPTLAKALNNPELTDQQREEMMNGVVNAVMVKLGYNTYENKLVSTDEKGRDAKDVKGFYSLETGDSYINQKNINNGNEGLIQVAGTEAQRAIDAQSGSKFDQSQEYRNARSLYSQNYGANVANYTNFALDYTGQGSLSTTTNSLTNTNQATSTPSIFNSQTANNNMEFSGLDKSKGDNLFFIPILIGMAAGGGIELATQVTPQIVDQLNDKGWEVKNLNTSNINVDWTDVGMMTAIGAVAPSGLTAAKSVYQSAKAASTLKKQKDTAKAVSKIKKLDSRIDNHTNNIAKNIGTQAVIAGGKIVLKEIDNTEEGKSDE